MPEYRLLRGTFRPRGADEPVTPEDDDPVVELTEEQRAAYAPGKFERASERGPTRDDEPTTPMSDADPDEPEASTELPDDWQLLRSMAVVAADEYDVPIDGTSSADEMRDTLGEFEPGEIAQLKQKARNRLED